MLPVCHHMEVFTVAASRLSYKSQSFKAVAGKFSTCLFSLRFRLMFGGIKRVGSDARTNDIQFHPSSKAGASAYQFLSH